MSEKMLCANCGLMDIKDSETQGKYCAQCGESNSLKCDECGNKRWFYSDVSIAAKQLIDLKNGKQDEKVYDIDKDNIDNFFETIYCKKCENVVIEAVMS